MRRTLFNLQEREKIVKEIKPEPGLKWYFIFSFEGIAAGGIIIIPIFYFLLILNFVGNFFLYLPILIVVFIIFDLIFAILRYNKQYYWITNKRLVYKRGIIGYRITSIPYERISDIIISRTFFENIFGFGSLHVQTLAGQVSGRHSLGSEGVLLAIPNPEETQELIFKLVGTKRKEEGLHF